MIRFYLSKGKKNGKDVIFSHNSDPSKLFEIKEIINEVRTLTFGKDQNYAWENDLKNFDNKTVIKIKIESGTNYEVEEFENFDHLKEIKPLEVLLSEGVARDKSVVVFQYVSERGKLRDKILREQLNSLREGKFPGKKMVPQPNIENFEFKPVIKLTFKDGEEPKVNYIPKYHSKPRDGVYKAPRTKTNMGISIGQAIFEDLIEDKDAFLEKVLRKVSR